MVNFNFFQSVTEIFPNTQVELLDQRPLLGFGLREREQPFCYQEALRELSRLSSSNSCLVATAHRQEQPNLQQLIKVIKRLFPNAQKLPCGCGDKGCTLCS